MTSTQTKVIDCFIFYNELQLLDYRLNVLNSVVDYFVIVESKFTFTGKEKQLYFNENKDKFEMFKDKIIHIIVEDCPYKFPTINFNKREQWQNEYFQRNAISQGIQAISLQENDAIIIADLDEIPDPRLLAQIKSGDLRIDIHTLEMDFYYYNLHSRFNDKWAMAKILSYSKYKELHTSCEAIRTRGCPILKCAGWHLSYFGDSKFIQNKIINFSHQELNHSEFTDIEKIQERIVQSRDLYDRRTNMTHIKLDENTYLPIDYDKYLVNFF
jgi:beta-1,4-mannosyl-glycoprotein beta-1,4-N-acetylglucosaminyltransferase